MSNPADLVRYLIKRKGEMERIIEDYPHGGFQRDLDIIETLLDLVEDDQVKHFWFMVENGWDIEPRSYFEKEAESMGFRSPIEMAVHHMWKRHTKDYPSDDLRSLASQLEAANARIKTLEGSVDYLNATLDHFKKLHPVPEKE